MTEVLIENKLVINDYKYCQFITSDTTNFNKLRKFLSYRAAGVEYTAAYKNGWSGITYLINTKGIFMQGLLPKVKDFLIKNNITFTLFDNRKEIIQNESIDLGKKLKKFKLIPRDYQEEIVNVALQNNKGIIRACTGSGKTICTALITAKLNKPTIIYVIGLDLLKQFHDLFSKLFDEEIGYIGNGICDIKRINIATIWSIGKAIKLDKKNILAEEEESDEESELNEDQYSKVVSLLEETKLHIFDESHVITTNTINEIYKHITPEHIYGFSGTPFRDDNTDLLVHGMLGEQVINISASLLIDKGVLAQPIIKFIPVPPLNMTTAPYQTVYKSYIVDNDIRNNIIINQIKGLLDKKYTPLVLFKQIKHGQILLDLLKENNIKCEMLYGNDSLDRRTEVKELLTDKKIDVILASTIFDLGVDIPMLNSLVLCGSGKSTIRSLQRIGRVIRGYPGKKFAAVVDFYDQTKFLKKHSKIRFDTYASEDGFKLIRCKEMDK